MQNVKNINAMRFALWRFRSALLMPAKPHCLTIQAHASNSSKDNADKIPSQREVVLSIIEEKPISEIQPLPVWVKSGFGVNISNVNSIDKLRQLCDDGAIGSPEEVAIWLMRLSTLAENSLNQRVEAVYFLKDNEKARTLVQAAIEYLKKDTLNKNMMPSILNMQKALLYLEYKDNTVLNQLLELIESNLQNISVSLLARHVVMMRSRQCDNEALELLKKMEAIVLMHIDQLQKANSFLMLYNNFLYIDNASQSKIEKKLIEIVPAMDLHNIVQTIGAMSFLRRSRNLDLLKALTDKFIEMQPVNMFMLLTVLKSLCALKYTPEHVIKSVSQAIADHYKPDVAHISQQIADNARLFYSRHLTNCLQFIICYHKLRYKDTESLSSMCSWLQNMLNAYNEMQNDTVKKQVAYVLRENAVPLVMTIDSIARLDHNDSLLSQTIFELLNEHHFKHARKLLPHHFLNMVYSMCCLKSARTNELLCILNNKTLDSFEIAIDDTTYSQLLKRRKLLLIVEYARKLLATEKNEDPNIGELRKRLNDKKINNLLRSCQLDKETLEWARHLATMMKYGNISCSPLESLFELASIDKDAVIMEYLTADGCYADAIVVRDGASLKPRANWNKEDKKTAVLYWEKQSIVYCSDNKAILDGCIAAEVRQLVDNGFSIVQFFYYDLKKMNDVKKAAHIKSRILDLDDSDSSDSSIIR